MTLQDLKDNKTQIIAKYYELGGIESMLKEFMLSLAGCLEFQDEDNHDVLCYVSEIFNPRFTGKPVKKNLRDIMSGIALQHEDKGEKWNPILKEWTK